MSKRRKALCAFALLMIVAGIVIAHIWFGLFCSPKYYIGFDRNTNIRLTQKSLRFDGSFDSCNNNLMDKSNRF